MTPASDPDPRPPLDVEPPPEPPPPAPAEAPPGWWRRRTRHIQLGTLGLGYAAILAVSVYLIGAGPAPAAATPGSSTPATSAPAASAAKPAASSDAVRLAGRAAASPPTIELDAGPAPKADDAPPAEAPPPEPPPPPDKPDRKGGMTVELAAKRSCSTAQIDGLSRQIVAESRCLDGNAFARIPARRNLKSAGHVFLYLDAPARDHLLRVLDANPNRVLTVHSALRTVAQQYLLSRWATTKRCGIQLATRPGESNHETGLALDVSQPGTWRAAMESEGFRWLGSIDRVHFDFVGPGATHHQGLDIRAFQRLWNRNHPGDVIAESGRYDTPTEIRLKRSPAAGFPIGARCGGGHDGRTAGTTGPGRAAAR